MIVLGMHRSGTSVVSSMLEELGVFFGEPDDMIPASMENPHGFWERDDVRRLNDYVLHAMQCEWDELSGFDLEKLLPAHRQYFETQARDIIGKLGTQATFGIKEPRLCLTLPLWIKHLPNPMVVRTWRKPSEIAASLRKRNGIPEPVALELCKIYLNGVLQQGNDVPTLSIAFGDLFSKPNDVANALAAFMQTTQADENTASASSDKAESAAARVDASLQRAAATANEDVRDADIDAMEAVMFGRQESLRFTLSTDSVEKLRSYELSRRFGLRTQIAELERQRTLHKIQISNSAERGLKLERALGEKTAREKALRSALTDKDDAVKAETRKISARLTEYQTLNNQLSQLFATRVWRVASLAFAVRRRLLPKSGSSTLVHDIARTRQGIDRKMVFSRQNGDSRYELDESSLCYSQQTPSVSLIVLNRNGKDHLGRLFESILKYEELSVLELIIVDHHSSDGSIAYIQSMFAKLPIRLMRFTTNNSFSFGNNIAAKVARAPFLSFVNNDIILDQAIFQSMANTLRDSANVGIVGLPLYFPDASFGRSDRLQHNGITFRYDAQYLIERPVNIQEANSSETPFVAGAVTAALSMVRKDQFVSLGGFEEAYHYGYEDVDLSLKYSHKLFLSSVVQPKLGAVHNESATQKTDSSWQVTARRLNNIELLKARFGRRLIRRGNLHALENNQGHSGSPYTIGIVVTDDNPDTPAGDFFTAMEIAGALQSAYNWNVVYLPQKSRSRDWYDLEGIDCLLVLIDRYDLNKTRNASERLVSIAWVRNWFERWPIRSWFHQFDLVLSSSEKGARYLREQTSRPVDVLRIACNAERFSLTRFAHQDYLSDYCFTGSHWKLKRDIELFDPRALKWNFALYGKGWDQHEQFKQSYRGFLSYQELPKVYANTKLLVDDANHVTKPWASVNSRVFDGIAAGAMVITNGAEGAEETFAGLLPVYNDAEELSTLCTTLLSDDAHRESLSKKLRDEVMAKHTYAHRAEELHAILRRHFSATLSIAIKIGVPSHAQAHEWGDFHFAKALQQELILLGHNCRIDILPEWYGTQCREDDVALVLRGLSEYEPDPARINLMWMISHPDKIQPFELEQYDHIFVASAPHCATLSEQLQVPVSVLPQCTDTTRFSLINEDLDDGRLLFVGNSRLQLRPIVDHSIQADLDIHVHGGRWEELIPKRYIKGIHLNNETLVEHYSGCRVLLNDHWDTMLEYGFISNRLFDAAACGACIVSDDVAGLEDMFDGLVYTYDGSPEDLKDVVAKASAERSEKQAARAALAAKIAEEHSFKARARSIHETLLARAPSALEHSDGTLSGNASASTSSPSGAQ